MKMINKIVSAAVLAMAAASASAAPVYVGSWDLYGGQTWSTRDAPTYTGQEAAALLFGGVASDYAISTADSTIASINFSAWYDVYGIGPSVHAENHNVDTRVLGAYDSTGDTSAYIMDNAGGRNLINYAFLVDTAAEVPEPLTLGLVGLGLFGIAMGRRRKST